MKKALSVSLILTVLAVAAYLSKPSEATCLKETIQTYERERLSYTTQALPANMNADVLKQTAEKAFLGTLEIKDRNLYREISQTKGNTKTKIGWAAFGWVQVGFK